MLRLNNLRKIGLFLFQHEGSPVVFDLGVDVDAADKGLDEFFLTAELEAGGDGAFDGTEDGFVGAVGIVVFGHELEDVVDIDFDLFDEFELEDEVVVDVLFVDFLADADIVVDIEVGALVVLEIAGAEDLVAGKVVEGGEDVSEAKDDAEEADEVFLGGFAENGLAEGELGEQAVDEVGIAGFVFAVFGVAVVVVLIGFEEDNTAGFFVAEKGDGFVGGFFEVAETDDIAEGFDGVEDTVGSRKGLDEAVLLEVLVDPEGIEGRSVEAGEEHVYDDEDVDLAVFDAQGEVFVVVLEFVGRGVKSGVEGSVVVDDCGFEEVARGLVKLVRFKTFVREYVFGIVFVDAEAVDGRDVKIAFLFFELAADLGVVFHRKRDG